MTHQQKHPSGPSRAKGSSRRRSQTRTVSTLDAPKRAGGGGLPKDGGRGADPKIVAVQDPGTGPHLVFNFNYYLS